MDIQHYWFWQLPSKLPTATYVVIDTWAATHNLSLILSKNPQKLFITNEHQYSKLQQHYPRAVLVGESQTHDLDFYSSNHPPDIKKADLKNKVVLFMSYNGTRVFEKLMQSQAKAYALSFSNLAAVAKLLQHQPPPLTIIKSGTQGKPAPEDEACANVFTKQLNNHSYDWFSHKTNVFQAMQQTYDLYDNFRLDSARAVLHKDIFETVPVCHKTPKGYLHITPHQQSATRSNTKKNLNKVTVD